MASTAPDAYDDLLDRYETVSNLGHVSMLLNWDQQVTMPPGGAPARGKQLSTVSTVRHDVLTDDETGALLDELEAMDLTPEQAAVVREIRYDYDRQASVPRELVSELSETQTESQETWKTAKAENDFDAFAPYLEDLRDLHVERASHIDDAKPAYDVLYEDGEPHLPRETIQDIFETLKDELVPLIDRIQSEGRDLPAPIRGGHYPEEHQRAMCETALDLLGYDRDHGRLDTAAHPFMSGNQFDARVTTRFKDEDPIDALTATVHEFGHASYQLGLPTEHYGSPLGESLSSGLHESQSRFWENHVGRTEAFWELFLPRMKAHLDGIEDVTPEEAWQAANQIFPENRIRVEADELTYHMHIILRCEIDEAFVAGEIEADEIPQLWNEKMEQYLGIVPDDDAEGCLQDIHWSYGFAGFQSYTIGSVAAAQLNAAMREEVDDVDEKIRNGNFGPLRSWMEENVHSHGRRYETDELIERATGEPLTADYFVDYATEKFERLYDL